MGILAADNQEERRSVLDALEVLRRETTFSDYDRAMIAVGSLSLPGQDTIGLLYLKFECELKGAVAVFLPSSFELRAKSSHSEKFRTIKTLEFDNSIVDSRGRVALKNGQELRAVEIVVTTALRDPTLLEWAVIRATMEVLGAEAEQYLLMPFADYNGGDLEALRFMKSLDYSAIFGFQNRVQEPEKIFVAVRDLLRDRSPNKKTSLSRQKFYDALFRFGMWIPTPQPKG